MEASSLVVMFTAKNGALETRLKKDFQQYGIMMLIGLQEKELLMEKSQRKKQFATYVQKTKPCSRELGNRW